MASTGFATALAGLFSPRELIHRPFPPSAMVRSTRTSECTLYSSSSFLSLFNVGHACWIDLLAVQIVLRVLNTLAFTNLKMHVSRFWAMYIRSEFPNFVASTYPLFVFDVDRSEV